MTVDWLAEIPQHWQALPLRYVAEPLGGLTFAPEDICDANTGSLVLRSSNIQNGEIDLRDAMYVQTPVPSRMVLQPGDILVCSRNGSRALIGKNSVIPAELAGQTFGAFMTVLRSRANDFLYWVLNSPLFEQQSATFLTATINQLTLGNFKSFIVPYPPESERRLIAGFLKRETGQIDQLIWKQERLIELLAEKRQAIITHAVTKGIDPTAPTRPSGVPKLGEIPAHWLVSRLKNVTQVRYGLGQPPREVEGGVPVIRATNVRSGRVSEKNLMFADPEDVPESRDAYLRLGEIIVVRSGANTADSTIIREEYVGCLAGYDLVVRPMASDPEFTAWALLSDYIRTNQLVLASSRAAQPHLNVTELGEAAIVLPPLEEQSAVASTLNKRTKHIDAMISRSISGISLLRERRSALISAAVTGKIDVRKEAS